MKKILNGYISYKTPGRKDRITCVITNENGYISITGEIKPYRCKNTYACGYLHKEIAEAFPRLRPYLWLHLYNMDGTQTFEIENSLFYLLNGEDEAARNCLNCSDGEFAALKSLVTYGLHKTRKSYGYIYNENTLAVYAAAVKKYNIQERHKMAVNEFLKFVDTL